MNAFDEQLSLSSPPVPARTRELDDELARIVAEAERATAGPRARRNLRLAVGELVLAGTLGVGGAAAAAGLLPWFDSPSSSGVVESSTGARCALAFDVKEQHDPGSPVSDAVRAEAVTVAQAYLRDLDVSALDVARATQEAGPRRRLDSEAGAAQTVPEHEVDAVYQLVAKGLQERLDQERLPIAAVSLSMASSCDGGDR